jgi:hypothetical protein
MHLVERFASSHAVDRLGFSRDRMTAAVPAGRRRSSRAAQESRQVRGDERGGGRVSCEWVRPETSLRDAHA